MAFKLVHRLFLVLQQLLVFGLQLGHWLQDMVSLHNHMIQFLIISLCVYMRVCVLYWVCFSGELQYSE